MVQIKNSGIFDYIKRFEKISKGIILGICGGFQIMGSIIKDPYKLEFSYGIDNAEAVGGLGFFDIETILLQKKITVKQKYSFQGNLIEGYEIHNGRSFLKDYAITNYDSCNSKKSFSNLLFKPADFDNYNSKERDFEFYNKSQNEVLSLISHDGRKIGTYVHGLFSNKVFRDFLENTVNKFKKNKNKNIGQTLNNNKNSNGNNFDYAEDKNENFNILSDYIEKYVDIKLFKEIIGI